jgi:hypothetical protein
MGRAGRRIVARGGAGSAPVTVRRCRRNVGADGERGIAALVVELGLRFTRLPATLVDTARAAGCTNSSASRTTSATARSPWAIARAGLVGPSCSRLGDVEDQVPRPQQGSRESLAAEQAEAAAGGGGDVQPVVGRAVAGGDPHLAPDGQAAPQRGPVEAALGPGPGVRVAQERLGVVHGDGERQPGPPPLPARPGGQVTDPVQGQRGRPAVAADRANGEHRRGLLQHPAGGAVGERGDG